LTYLNGGRRSYNLQGKNFEERKASLSKSCRKVQKIVEGGEALG